MVLWALIEGLSTAVVSAASTFSPLNVYSHIMGTQDVMQWFSQCLRHEVQIDG